MGPKCAFCGRELDTVYREAFLAVVISPSLSYESRGGEALPFRMDLRGCGVEGLGVGARDTELGREDLGSVND